MSKIVLLPTSTKIEPFFPYLDAILFGIKGMSVNIPLTLSLKEAKEVISTCQEVHKEVFVALNKNMLEEDLEILASSLKELDVSKPTGFVFYDVAVLTFAQTLPLKTPLVWGQEHNATNYATCNFWAKQGVQYGILSGEITLKEIETIRNHTTMKLMVPFFGYLPMFVSKRPFLTNYTKHFGLKRNGFEYTLEKEGMRYPILEDETGTIIYSGYILNGFEEYCQKKDIGIDYILLNSFQISEENMVEVVKAFCYPEKENHLNELFPNSDKGFLYKETIYKVKNYD